MRQQVERGLAVADEVVVDEVHRAANAAFQQLVEFAGDLLRRFQARITAVEAGNVAEFALIRTAAGILNAAEEIARNFGQFVSGNRKARHIEPVGGLQHHLLRRPRRIAREARDQVIGGITQFADVQIVE